MPAYDRKDRFYQQAKKQGYVARSAYKLIEMDKKFGILKGLGSIIDLGCAPGGWLQVMHQKAPRAKIAGIDLLPLKWKAPDTLYVVQGDFLEEEHQQKLQNFLSGKADWIVSDMAPNLTGVKFKDTSSSWELAEMALEFARQNLKTGGSFMTKIFPGPELKGFKKSLLGHFKKVTQFVPESTRKTSSEVYLVANNLLRSK